MYITIGEKRFENVNRFVKEADVIYSGSSLTGIEEVSGEIVLCRNDGFEMLREDADSYARCEISDGQLLLTNRPVPTAKEMREKLYETDRRVQYESEGDALTVDEASDLWMRYTAEGNTERADILSGLIRTAKDEIRAEWPDENGGAEA